MNEDTIVIIYLVLKLVRLQRIPQIISLFDLSRLHPLFMNFISGKTRSRKVVTQHIMKNVYKFYSLTLLTSIIIYIAVCTFYFTSSIQNDQNLFKIGTDFTSNSLEEDPNPVYGLLTSSYDFIMSLSTVGYVCLCI